MFRMSALAVPATGGGRGSWVVGVLLILAGLLCIVLPFFAGVAVTGIVGWLLLFAAFAHLLYAWSARGAGSVIWQIVIGLVYLAVALYLIFHPARGLLTLTLLLACYFVVEGVLELVIYFQLRRVRRSGWFLLDALITLFLGGLIWAHWPFSSVWALGTIVGVSLLSSGFTRLSFGGGRTALPAAGSPEPLV